VIRLNLPSLNQSGYSADEITWDNPMLDQDALKLRAILDPTFKYAFQIDRTDDFMEWMDKRIFQEHANVVAEAIGRTGSGKSYTINTCSYITDKRWTPRRNVKYSLDGILESPDKQDSPISWCLDEVARGWGTGTYRSVSEWENYIESIRKKQHSVFTATPVRKPLGTTMWCLEPVRMSRSDEVVQLALSNEKRHTLGYVIISAPWHFMPRKMVEEYETLKDAYISKVLMREGTDNISQRIEDLLGKYKFELVGESTNPRLAIDGNMMSMHDVLEIVNNHYPYLQRNNEACAIADGIKSRLKLKRLGIDKLSSES